MQFSIRYYPIDEKVLEDYLTTVNFGEKTAVLKLNELNINDEKNSFKGWRLFRELDGKWYLRDEKGREEWMYLDDDKLPSGYEYVLKKDGFTLSKAATSGVVRLYGTWS